ncbi:hypothetical protein ACVWY2_008508 [Bradyrhizobium sp. JR6.1]
MAFAIERETTVGGYDLLDAAVHQQLPWAPISATVRGRNVPEGEIPRPLADPVEGARGWGSVGVSDLADVVIHKKLSNIQVKLKDLCYEERHIGSRRAHHSAQCGVPQGGEVGPVGRA